MNYRLVSSVYNSRTLILKTLACHTFLLSKCLNRFRWLAEPVNHPGHILKSLFSGTIKLFGAENVYVKMCMGCTCCYSVWCSKYKDVSRQ